MGVFKNLYPIIKALTPDESGFLTTDQLRAASLNPREINRACKEGFLVFSSKGCYGKCDLSPDRILKEESKLAYKEWDKLNDKFNSLIVHNNYEEAYIVLKDIIKTRISKENDNYYRIYLLLLEKILFVKKSSLEDFDFLLKEDDKLISRYAGNGFIRLQKAINNGELEEANKVIKHIYFLEKTSMCGGKSCKTTILLKLIDRAILVFNNKFRRNEINNIIEELIKKEELDSDLLLQLEIAMQQRIGFVRKNGLQNKSGINYDYDLIGLELINMLRIALANRIRFDSFDIIRYHGGQVWYYGVVDREFKCLEDFYYDKNNSLSKILLAFQLGDVVSAVNFFNSSISQKNIDNHYNREYFILYKKLLDRIVGVCTLNGYNCKFTDYARESEESENFIGEQKDIKEIIESLVKGYNIQELFVSEREYLERLKIILSFIANSESNLSQTGTLTRFKNYK